MGNIGDTFSTSVPTVGTAGPGFATDINAILTECISRLSSKVPLSSILFNADLDLGGQSLLNTAGVTFTQLGGAPSGAPFARAASFNNDFYWVNPSGAVQITTGGTLNSASIGGITGAYGGANPAQFRYDNVNSRYDAYANFGTNTWAYVRALGFDIAAGATSAVFARLAFAGVANRTYTLPAAPASAGDRPLYMDTSGNITVGHGTKTYAYSAAGSTIEQLGIGTNGNIVYSTPGSGWTTTGGASSPVSKGVDGLLVGFSITSFTLNLRAKTNATACNLFFYKQPPGGVAAVLLGTATTTALGAQNVTVTLGSPEVVAANTTYHMQFVPAGVASGETYSGFMITGTLPG